MSDHPIPGVRAASEASARADGEAPLSRRRILGVGGGLLGAALGTASLPTVTETALAQSAAAPLEPTVAPTVKPATLPTVEPGAPAVPATLSAGPLPRVTFPPISAPSEPDEDAPPNPLPPERRLGVAVVGLGRLSLEQIIPAFGAAKRVKLAALVSGNPDKAAAIGAQYGVPTGSLYGYADFDRLRDNPAVDIVYVVLPNAMHLEFTVRSARAGKHVLCEKPMAVSSAEARQMIEACKTAGRQLMIAYRCQYEPHHRALIAMARGNRFGPLKLIDAFNGQVNGDPRQWRLNRRLAGGGCLPDVGIYCLNFARYITGEEPVEVFARLQRPADDPRFREVEESVGFMLRFPSGVIANLGCSYDTHQARQARVYAAEGWYQMDPAFAYEALTLQVAHKSDGADQTIEHRQIANKNQFALEMDHMAECVMTGRRPHTPGEEGLQDHLIMEAIYRSAETGQMVSLPLASGLDVTRGPPPETR